MDYGSQKYAANRRGIAFMLSFAEWLAVWKASGKLSQKGRRSHEYCMSRFGDKGAYAVENVRIVTGAENRKEQEHKKGIKFSAAVRRRMSVAALGKVISPATREKMSQSRLGKKMSLETRQKIANAHFLLNAAKREVLEW